ncbi:MAG: RiPP maturation radical SAM C-methyltransferase, partial [Pseudomonadota bacterium]
FGGANWEGEMGKALFQRFPFVDHVCQGEADESFPALVAALARGDAAPAIAGVLSREGPPALPAKPVTALDDTAYPDFSAFFETHARVAPSEPPVLLMETSRGCWWGAKHHCTFCGLNGQGMGFRSKSAQRAVDELRHLTQEHEVPIVSMVDNILDMKYFDTVLPEIAATPETPVLFYETKANLSRKQIGQLAEARVLTIQPGIESLSDRVLKLMRKGTTGLRNIQLLKWCRELGISVEWNILYGFPGETDTDYDRTLDLMPQLAHLQPPSGSGPVRIDRFSPYFETPEAFGITKLRPLPVFEYLYPFDEATRARIACYFEAEYKTTIASPETVDRIMGAIDAWQAASHGHLNVEDTGDALAISDTRHGAAATHLLQGPDRLIYLICDQITAARSVVQKLERLGAGSYDKADVTAYLDRLVDAGLMVSDDGLYLALGVYDRFPTGWDRAVTPERIAAE